MPKLSAGIVLVDVEREPPRILLVHPGGPFWRNKDDGAWSIPKGEYEPSEPAEAAALREFEEELGVPCPPGPRIAIGSIRQSGGKVVDAWAVSGSVDADAIVSGTFEMEWPPRSGRQQAFPEVDRAGWFTLDEAMAKAIPGQRPLLERAVAAFARGELTE